MVYVLNKNGQPLMPTNRYGKVKHLLRSDNATVVKRCPFTIQLTYESTSFTQDLSMGVDAGSKTIGVSVTSSKKELFAAEVTLRNDIVNNLSKSMKILMFYRTGNTSQIISALKMKMEEYITPVFEMEYINLDKRNYKKYFAAKYEEYAKTLL